MWKIQGVLVDSDGKRSARLFVSRRAERAHAIICLGDFIDDEGMEVGLDDLSKRAPCPYTVMAKQHSPGHVDGPNLDSCGFNRERYEVLTTHDDGSPFRIKCRACGVLIDNV